jgi:RimJ/RimL family protein N-acetyltransferase
VNASGSDSENTPTAVLVTERLVLRPVDHDDLAEYHQLHNDAELFEHERAAQHPHLEYSRTMIDDIRLGWQSNGLDHWTIRHRDDRHYIGVAGARLMAGDGPGVWSLYYRMHLLDWGNGYTHEALRAVAGQIVALDPEAELVATLHPANLRSAAVARRLGLRYGYTRLGFGGTAELVFSARASDVR